MPKLLLHTKKTVLIAAFFLLLSGCAPTAPVTKKIVTPYAKLMFIASDDINLDDNQRPSPIKVKLVQLASRHTFDNLTFAQAFYQSDSLLGQDLLSPLTEFVLQPQEDRRVSFHLSSGTQYIGIVAGYRHANRTQWKHVMPVKDYRYYHRSFTLSANGIAKGKLTK